MSIGDECALLFSLFLSRISVRALVTYERLFAVFNVSSRRRRLSCERAAERGSRRSFDSLPPLLGQRHHNSSSLGQLRTRQSDSV